MLAESPNAQRVKVYGPAIERPVAPYELTYLIVDCKEAGPGEWQSVNHSIGGAK